MSNRIKLVRQPDGIWTTDVEGVTREVVLDESPVIVWRTLGLHPGGAVEVTQSSKGHIESLVLIITGEVLNEVEFSKTHTLGQAMNIRNQYPSEF